MEFWYQRHRRCSERFLSQTINYWDSWVKHCSIPSLYGRKTIRSALTLKLHCYEDTGAILAALTTSLPEERGETPELGLSILLATGCVLRAFGVS